VSYDRAFELQLEALDLNRRERDEGVVRRALFQLGWLSLFSGELDRAREYLGECASLMRDAGDVAVMALARTFLGEAHRLLGDLELALELVEECVEIMRERRLGRYLSWSLFHRGCVLVDMGELGRARASFVEVTELWKDVGNGNDVVEIVECFVRLFAASGDAERALRLEGAALAAREADRDPRPPVYATELEARLAPVRAALGDEASALALAWGRAMTLDEGIEYGLETKLPGV